MESKTCLLRILFLIHDFEANPVYLSKKTKYFVIPTGFRFGDGVSEHIEPSELFS